MRVIDGNRALSTMATQLQSPLEPLSTLEEQDGAVFGTVNEQLAESLAQFVQGAIQEGVQSLPLLQDAKKAQALIETIQKPYLKHIDLVELYGERNLFTLRHMGPRRRQKIAQHWQSGTFPVGHASSVSTTGTDEDPTGTSNSTASLSVPSSQAQESSLGSLTITYPTREEIPSSLDLEQLQQELAVLASQVQTAKARRDALIQESVSLDKALSLTDNAVDSIQQAQLHPLEPVTTAVTGGQSLQQLSLEAGRLRQELLHSQQSSSSTTDSQEDDTTTLPLASKKRGLSLQETYFQDRQAMSTNLENLASMANFLKQSKRKRNSTIPPAK